MNGEAGESREYKPWERRPVSCTWDAVGHGPRPWLKEKREALGLTRRQMAKKCQCSVGMLRMLEDEGEITVPGIVARIAVQYGLTVDEFNDLVHPDRRVTELPEPHDPPDMSMYGEIVWHNYNRQQD